MMIALYDRIKIDVFQGFILIGSVTRLILQKLESVLFYLYPLFERE
jgi:hypothetical protein